MFMQDVSTLLPNFLYKITFTTITTMENTLITFTYTIINFSSTDILHNNLEIFTSFFLSTNYFPQLDNYIALSIKKVGITHFKLSNIVTIFHYQKNLIKAY